MTSVSSNAPVRQHRVVVMGPDHARGTSLRCRLADHGFDAALAGTEAGAVQLVRTAPGACTVLYDLRSDDTRAWEVLLRLGRHHPSATAVVAAEEPEDPTVDLCLLAGARSVVDVDATDAALVAAVDGARRQDPPQPEVAARRRRALRHLASAGDAPRSGVHLSALEPGAAPSAPTPGPERDRALFDSLGPAQRALVVGLVRGAGVRAIAQDRGVSTSAMYAARRRLVARLDIRHDHVVEELRQRFGRLVSSGGLPSQTVHTTPATSRTGRSHVRSRQTRRARKT